MHDFWNISKLFGGIILSYIYLEIISMLMCNVQVGTWARKEARVHLMGSDGFGTKLWWGFKEVVRCHP